MKALQYCELGAPPRVVIIPDPVPVTGQVLLKVTAASACHSDILHMSRPKEKYLWGLPLTLGHEGAGVVAALGEGVEHVAIGDAVAVYGPWGCGYCHNCSQGKENFCTNAAALGIRPPGLGSPGAMAEYMIVDSPRHLIPLGDLDPVKNVSLTDAGLTPYHAIKSALHTLGPGSTAVVIGAGGLGHVGIQIIRALTAATVIALDVTEGKLTLARKVGAHHAILSNREAVGAIKNLTGGLGANAVFDFVGAPPTVKIAAAVAAMEAEISIVGIAGGALSMGSGTTARDVGVRAPYWGSRSELIEVFDLARAGSIIVETETFSLDEAPRAYELLNKGEIRGRAVVVPD
jgi:alcohol dehydrogenase, propanol-preferring